MLIKTNFLFCIKNCSKTEHLEKMLAFNLSPVLQQVKPSELVILKKDCFEKIWRKENAGIIKALGLSCRQLNSSSDSLYLLFYNDFLLRDMLFSSTSQNILKKSSYKNTLSLQSLFYQLQKRLNNDVFPHEIGLFLGYPAHDVEGFIRFSGKNFCACKYWKVYENIEYSLDKFRQIDMARNQAAILLTGNSSLKNAVKLIRTM